MTAQDDAQDMPGHTVPGEDKVITHADRSAIREVVTELKSAEQQIGEHIVRALSDDQTVAVITTVVVGRDGRQRIVSAGLSPEMLEEVQSILEDAQEQREEEVPCVGFHCYIRNRGGTGTNASNENGPVNPAPRDAQ